MTNDVGRSQSTAPYHVESCPILIQWGIIRDHRELDSANKKEGLIKLLGYLHKNAVICNVSYWLHGAGLLLVSPSPLALMLSCRSKHPVVP